MSFKGNWQTTQDDKTAKFVYMVPEFRVDSGNLFYIMNEFAVVSFILIYFYYFFHSLKKCELASNLNKVLFLKNRH